ncbi:MAG: hypothetical protein HY885_13715 [Deltaproteobacteria bacterium]|nr:hypothetical protein [Deltaproteobacteria bacterium]
MRGLKIIGLTGIISGLWSPFALADTIDQIILPPGEPRAVEISGTLSGCGERNMTSLTTSVDDMLIIQLFADPLVEPVEPCLMDGIPFTRTFTLSAASEYAKIIALLYSGSPAAEATMLQDYVTLTLDAPNSEATCQDDCTTGFGLCLADCNTAVTACISLCPAGDIVCLDACNSVQTLCQSECDTAQTNCLSSCTLSATANCTPETLNINANGNWITCALAVPADYALEDIDVTSIYLDGVIPADKAVVEDGLLKLKFSRAELVALIKDDDTIEFPMEKEVTVSGALSDGITFTATDSITLINPPAKGNQNTVRNEQKTQGNGQTNGNGKATSNGNGNGKSKK